MTSMLNTLRYARALKNAGVGAQQAEAMADALDSEMTGELASKADITEVKADIEKLATSTKADVQRLETQIGHLDEKLTGQMTALEQRMTIRLGGLIVAGVAFLAALDKLL